MRFPYSACSSSVIARRALLALTVALVSLSAGPLEAFGPIGHRAIGRIAEKHVTPAATAQIRRLIGPQTLAQVSTWADEIRSDPNWSHSAVWHYVSVEDGETYQPRERPAGENPRDVVEAIDHFTAIL